MGKRLTGDDCRCAEKILWSLNDGVSNANVGELETSD